MPVFLPKSASSVVADIGALYSCNAYANLDVKSPPQRLKGMLDNLHAEVIITSAAYVAALLKRWVSPRKSWSSLNRPW